jgi:hypothetical protein
MQPNPTAETSGPRVPSLRSCIALQYRLPEVNHRFGRLAVFDPGSEEGDRASADHGPPSSSSALRRSRASRCISSTMWSPPANVASASRIWEM